MFLKNWDEKDGVCRDRSETNNWQTTLISNAGVQGDTVNKSGSASYSKCQILTLLQSRIFTKTRMTSALKHLLVPVISWILGTCNANCANWLELTKHNKLGVTWLIYCPLLGGFSEQFGQFWCSFYANYPLFRFRKRLSVCS